MSGEMASMSKKLAWARGEGVVSNVSNEVRTSEYLSTVDEVSKLKDGIETGIDELADVAATTRNTVQADGRARWNSLIIYLAGGDAGDAAEGPVMEPPMEVAKNFANNAMNTALPTTAMRVLGYGADKAGTAATTGMDFLKDQGIVDIEASSAEIVGEVQASSAKIFDKVQANSAEIFGEVQASSAEIFGEVQASSTEIFGDVEEKLVEVLPAEIAGIFSSGTTKREGGGAATAAAATATSLDAPAVDEGEPPTPEPSPDDGSNSNDDGVN